MTPFPGSTARYRRFTRLLLVTCVAGIVTWLPISADLKSTFAVTTLLASIAVAIVASALRRDWPAARPDKTCLLTLIGVGFITVAAAFDIGATLHHSPTLKYEANPIAVALLDNGTPLAWVLGMGAVAQLSATLVASLLWANFVVRREDYVAWLVAAQGHVPLPMRLLGARRRSIIDLLAGRNLEPGAQIVALGPFALAWAAYRVWLGLEWFGWAPLSRVLIPIGVLLGTYLLLWHWARRQLQQSPLPAA
ncbi:MAG TPA: hypothetical protein VIP30_06590 [Stenotrophomonas sp.]